MNSAGKEIADRRPGRRPGPSGTRSAIRAAAARQFAERGYDRASLRSIAAEAKVDPALVSHFFGTKHELFAAVIELPLDPTEALSSAFAGDPEMAGERLATFLLSALEQPDARRRMTGLIRAATSEPRAALMVRDLITRQVVAPIVGQLGVDDGELRATLVGSQIVGLVMARYIVRVEPLASLPAERVAAALAPNLQRYLTGPIG